MSFSWPSAASVSVTSIEFPMLVICHGGISMVNLQSSAKKIAELNDEFRRRGIGGSRYVTAGIQAEGPEFLIRVNAEVAAFNSFTADNDPYGQHDFGSLMIEGKKVFWKIDYYDRDQKYGSEDPSDPSKTHRVLTIMFAHEY